jgi:hypothetical protein
MRPSLVLSTLPAFAVAAEQQKPLGDIIDNLKGWWNKASSYVESSVPSIIPDPLDAGAAKVAEVAVLNLNSSNWKDILTPGESGVSSEQYEWLIYIDGGNKSCVDACTNASRAWNVSTCEMLFKVKGLVFIRHQPLFFPRFHRLHLSLQ